MKKDTTNEVWLYSLRNELKATRHLHRNYAPEPIYINVEDAIFTRLAEAEELLTVASGLFDELSEDKHNWFLGHQVEIVNVRWALHNVISDRAFAQ